MTSVIALGVIFALWSRSRPGGVLAGEALGAGWALMPVVLVASMRMPSARYALAVPTFLVTGALVAISVASPQAGWFLILAGVQMGGLLGAWFWFRLLPVPARLENPFAPGRWALIAVHVGLVVAGIALVGLSAV